MEKGQINFEKKGQINFRAGTRSGRTVAEIDLTLFLLASATGKLI